MKGFLIFLAICFIGTTSAAYKECHGMPLGKNVPYPGDCTRFLTCIGGGVVKECPPPLHFNAILEVCDWPESAGCHVKADKSSPSPVPYAYAECKGMPLGKNVPYPGDCTRFLTCIGGGVVKECPPPLHFNAILEVCDWPESAGCHVKAAKSSPGPVPYAYAECKGMPLGKNVPLTGDCTKFLTCIGGGVVKECPPPLHFNAILEVCDWPESANCPWWLKIFA